MPHAVEPYAHTDAAAALAFLDASPYENVFLSWLVRSDPAAGLHAGLRVYRESNHTLQGVAYFGRQVVLAADCDAAIDAFARAGRTEPPERMIVAPRPLVERYWSRVKTWHAAPRAVRESQPLLAIDGNVKHAGAAGVSVRRARITEWQTVAHNSALMIEQELEYDPRSRSGEFNANVRLMIERGLWWVGVHAGELCFFCSAGPQSVHTLQLQSIWTPPALRGRGLATAALAGVCRELLREFPSLSLYVNGFNVEAIALYERVGFWRAGEFATLLF